MLTAAQECARLSRLCARLEVVAAADGLRVRPVDRR